MALSFSHAVLAWARTKPATERYRYLSNGNCAIAQFLKETGRTKKPAVVGRAWIDEAVESRPLHLFDPRVDEAAGSFPATFGAFADRLEKALS